MLVQFQVCKVIVNIMFHIFIYLFYVICLHIVKITWIFYCMSIKIILKES